MELTQEHKQKIAPKLSLELDVINGLLARYKVDTSLRLAAFFAQVAHESGDFTHKVENLNYSADGLKRVFGKYFKDIDPQEYARNPQKIANLVYANRMGNGDESSGDGYKYRGRGFIQLTGKNNYTEFALHIQKLLDPTIEFLETDTGALQSALFFWDKHSLNTLADKKDFLTLTKRVNGGINGLEDRERRYKTYLEVLEA